MPLELPQGWVRTTLGEVCLRVGTIRPEDAPTAEFTYFDIGGIDNQRSCIAATKTIVGRSAPSRARQAVRKYDILFSTVRTYLKNVACIENDYPNPVASTGFTVIRPAEGVLSRFVLYQVLSDVFWSLSILCKAVLAIQPSAIAMYSHSPSYFLPLLNRSELSPSSMPPWQEWNAQKQPRVGLWNGPSGIVPQYSMPP